MNIPRSLLVVVGLAVPAWVSYILLPSDPGKVITEAIHSDIVFGHPAAAQSVDQSSAISESIGDYDLETLRQAVFRLESEIVSLKTKLKKLSMNKKSDLVQFDSKDETVKNIESSTKKNVIKFTKPDKEMRQQRMEQIETNLLNENPNYEWAEETEKIGSIPLVNL